MTKIVLVTGGFDPLHSGHIKYFRDAAKLGDKLYVGLNSDKWLANKKGKPFLPSDERMTVVKALSMVTDVITFNDNDGTACDAIKQLLDKYPNDSIIFANGGDRNISNIPEMTLTDPRLHFEFSIGGTDKLNSSSWILNNWKSLDTVERSWGYWRVLDNKQTVKVKELVIYPGATLSDQRHSFRSEHWYIIKGECCIDVDLAGVNTVTLTENKTMIIPTNTWHRAYNVTDVPCHVIEIQYGKECTEEDIERRS
jgi:D-beta-D-heptose 7-phosphate kinase/D-beta-D-heptose 1-phosphate adenosyltransferase